MDASFDLDSPAGPSLLDEANPFASSQTTDDEPTVRIRSAAAVSKASKSTASTPAPSAPVRREAIEHEDEPEAERERRQERDTLRAINASLETTLANLTTAKAKVERFGSTVATTHALMDLYTRILSQAAHTQTLLLDGEWDMATDLARMRADEEAERARIEAEERAAEEARTKLEREERAREEALARRRDAAAAQAPVARGRGGPRVARGASFGRGARSQPAPTAALPPAAPAPDAPPAGRGIRGSGTVTGVRGVRGLRSRVVSRGRGVKPPE